MYMWAPDTSHLYIPSTDNFYNAVDGVYYGLVLANSRIQAVRDFELRVTTSNAYTSLPVGTSY